ncbi:MAG: hypothetical protein LUE98_14480 [Tannerellaceae bacterium]|nr:hypothetical protein [Tannerellaceae bacterium]
MKNKIPRIIHQVWEGRTEPKIPIRLKILAESWKNQNPSWEYHLWNGDEMEDLVKTQFPDLLKRYKNFRYNVQRWDMIRYMILYHIGGVYADLDTECYKPIDDLLENKKFCFGEEPPEHNIYTNIGIKKFWGNAFMASSKQNEGWSFVISEIENAVIKRPRYNVVLDTTGPLRISKISKTLRKKYDAELLPYKQVTPITKNDLIQYAYGVNVQNFTKKIENAYCAHYFLVLGKKLIVYTNNKNNMLSLIKENSALTNAILHQSILNAELVNNNGIYGGKMGKVLFFCYYAKHSNNELYIEFADEILDKVVETLSPLNGIGFAYGLSGIGWGILHLMKNGFIEPDSSILNDIDKEIMKYDPRRFDDFTFETGLLGIMYYINYRISFSFLFNDKYPFDNIYHLDLKTFINSNQNIPQELINQIKLYFQLSYTNNSIDMEEIFIFNKILLTNTPGYNPIE